VRIARYWRRGWDVNLARRASASMQSSNPAPGQGRSPRSRRRDGFSSLIASSIGHQPAPAPFSTGRSGESHVVRPA